MYKALEEILKLARSQVGYKEKPDNNTKYSRYFDVEAWQWFNTKKNPGTDWCAIFICWLFTQVLGNKPALVFLGCPAPKNNCAAGCGYLYDYMKAKGYKSDIKNVKPGDIVFFKKGSKCAHVGIAETVSGGRVITIEGNKDNSVKRVTHNISSDIYFGVMSPDWSKAHWIGEKEDPAHHGRFPGCGGGRTCAAGNGGIPEQVSGLYPEAAEQLPGDRDQGGRLLGKNISVETRVRTFSRLSVFRDRVENVPRVSAFRIQSP